MAGTAGGVVRTAVAAVLPLWVLGDRDGDGYVDCADVCPDDAHKHSAAGHCGCGARETDTDGDGLPDCVDRCPFDPYKRHPVLVVMPIAILSGDCAGYAVLWLHRNGGLARVAKTQHSTDARPQ
eukprot:m51a1_g14699 putative outer membrane efflux family (124) ;mRNA; r:121898-122657